MKAVCDKYGALFILDEVFAGMGRTGTLHAWEQEDVIPDLQTVAKGLGAGYEPVGALMVGKRVVDALSKGTGSFMHFQTWHGHPVACAAAYEVQQVIKDEGLVENCRVVGAYLGEMLQKRFRSHKNVGQIRGRGMVWGVSTISLFTPQRLADGMPDRARQRQSQQTTLPGQREDCTQHPRERAE